MCLVGSRVSILACLYHWPSLLEVRNNELGSTR